jgi:hypothetical protein
MADEANKTEMQIVRKNLGNVDFAIAGPSANTAQDLRVGFTGNELVLLA